MSASLDWVRGFDVDTLENGSLQSSDHPSSHPEEELPFLVLVSSFMVNSGTGSERGQQNVMVSQTYSSVEWGCHE